MIRLYKSTWCRLPHCYQQGCGVLGSYSQSWLSENHLVSSYFFRDFTPGSRMDSSIFQASPTVYESGVDKCTLFKSKFIYGEMREITNKPSIEPPGITSLICDTDALLGRLQSQLPYLI